MDPHDEAGMVAGFRDHVRDPRGERCSAEAIFTRQ